MKAPPFERIVAVLLADPDGRHFGYETSRAASVRPRVLYGVLHRMLDDGWLADGWEDADLCRAAGRPPRRFYRLTATGRERLRAAMPDLADQGVSVDRGSCLVLALAFGGPIALVLLACLTPLGGWLVNH